MAISDASVVLAWSLVGRVDVVVKLTGKLVVPFPVKEEVREALAVLAPGRTFPGEDLVEVAFVDVPAGVLRQSEEEALALALRRGVKTVLSDDACVRREAVARGLRPLGTTGLLYAAQKKGLVEDARGVLSEMSGLGYTFGRGVWSALSGRLGKA
jgi:predicted nucleic acid-binding protein